MPILIDAPALSSKTPALPEKRGAFVGEGIGCFHGTLKVMEIHFSPSQESQLNELAVKTGRGTADLVQEAVTRLLARNEGFHKQVQVGIDQFERGEFIEEHEMDARVRADASILTRIAAPATVAP